MSFRLLFQCVMLSSLLLITNQASASNRWDVLHWCSAQTKEDFARCEGMVAAAMDVITSKDFRDENLCFSQKLQFNDVRITLVNWLKDHKISTKQTGLALLIDALNDSYGCRPSRQQ